MKKQIEELYEILEDCANEIGNEGGRHFHNLLNDAYSTLGKIELQSERDSEDAVDILLDAFNAAGLDTTNPSLKHELNSVVSGKSPDHRRLEFLIKNK